MIVECESYTIHKSQSKTLSKMGFYITANITQQLLYVGCSRVESLAGLYLILPNATSIRPIVPSAAMLRRKKNQLDENAAKNEMKRMKKEAMLINAFPFAEENYTDIENEKQINMMSLNVQGLGNNFIKLQAIENDPGFRHADLIFLNGCGIVNGVKSVNFKTKNHAYFNSYISTYYGVQTNDNWGSICLIKKELRDRITCVGYCNQRKSSSEYEWSLHKYEMSSKKYLFFCNVNISRNGDRSQNVEKIIKAVHNIIGKNKERLYLFGNFNLDFNQKNLTKEGVAVMNQLREASLIKDIPLFNTITHKSGYQLDWMFTNRINSQVTTSYPVWYSDHVTLHTKIKVSP